MKKGLSAHGGQPYCYLRFNRPNNLLRTRRSGVALVQFLDHGGVVTDHALDGEMLGGAPSRGNSHAIAARRVIHKTAQHARKIARVAPPENCSRLAGWTQDLGDAASVRADDTRPDGHRLEGGAAERFFPLRGDDHDVD